MCRFLTLNQVQILCNVKWKVGIEDRMMILNAESTAVVMYGQLGSVGSGE